jgi:adenosylhomocysteine nucleosidase
MVLSQLHGLLPPAGGLALAFLNADRQTKDTTPAFVVGFSAEARIARRLGWPVSVGGGSARGATAAALRLVEAGATGLVSFGLAGGLDSSLPAGALVVANAVVADGQMWRTDAALSARLGGTTGHLCLGLDRIVAAQTEKRRLGLETGAAMADMESAAVAAVADMYGLPFAVLRAICDPASRALPPAALVALDASGRIALTRVIRSILTRPGQLPALIGLAREAAVARRALRRRVSALRSAQQAR